MLHEDWHFLAQPLVASQLRTLVHKKPRCFEPRSFPKQCRQAGIHRGRDAKAALEGAESADPQSANLGARRVLDGYSTLGAVPYCALPLSEH